MKILKLIFVGVIALALIVELGIRLFFSVPLEPGATILLTNEIPGFKPSVRFSYDGDQLRKLDWSESRQSENLRVLCFGGNATTSILQKSEDTWWGVLSSELSKQMGEKVEVAALAHNPRGHILSALVKAEALLEKYEVDLIICCFGFGDAMAFYGDYTYDPGKLEGMRLNKPSGFKYSLAKASHILRVVRNSRTRKFLRGKQKPFIEPNYLKKQFLLRRNYCTQLPLREGIIRVMRTGDDPIREYVDGIRGFISLAENKGAQLLVMEESTIHDSKPSKLKDDRAIPIFFPSIPKRGDGYQVSPLAVAQELRRFFDEGRRECEQSGVQWLTLQDGEPLFEDYFAGETYFTDKGARAMALRILAPVLQVLKPAE
jgi:hypothetical protein